MDLNTEPRLHKKVKAFLASIRADRNRPPSSLTLESSLDEIAETLEGMEVGTLALYVDIPLNPPENDSTIYVELTVEVIQGGDGQDMKVYIYRPKTTVTVRQEDQEPPALPCVVYIHGGAATLIPTFNRVHDRWARSLSSRGVVVAMVDFRNAWTKNKYHHFPAGLNDCLAAVRWLWLHRQNLHIRSIVLEGDSGGANLALATALKFNQEPGWSDAIAGVYALIPYISNAYRWSRERKLIELPSLVECDGYLFNMQSSASTVRFYSPREEDWTDPLAWPYHTEAKDMKGLPPHVLVMDELDPFRGEGIRYARMLIQAGVDVDASVNMGVPHGTSIALSGIAPSFGRRASRDVVAFAKSL